MDLAELLQRSADEIVAAAMEAVKCRHLPHYEEAGGDATRRRLRELHDVVVASVRQRRLDLVVDHARRLARERFAAGFDLLEVQSAINVLEEAVWKVVLREVPPADYAQALGLASTVLGAGKDALAGTWVSLAGSTRNASLDLSALFKGTETASEE